MKFNFLIKEKIGEKIMKELKALEILKSIQSNETLNWEYIGLQEAIAELEALQAPKTCDGCKWEDDCKTLIESGCDIDICSLCTRGTNDYYEPKDKE